MKDVLLVEDEPSMAEAVRFSLEKEGFSVRLAADGETALRLFDERAPDIMLLDLMLPVLDGMEVCRRIRKQSAVPIIMLTARDADVDKIVGLELGADDYITKPFNMRELIARVSAVLRRTASAGSDEAACITRGPLVLDRDRHEVRLDGDAVRLSPMEYRLLELFMQHPGKVLAREYLIAKGWGGDFYGQTKTLDVHIRRLREKIEEDSAHPRHIVTVRGVGYRFDTH
ncbi:MAG: response regulator [Candidatus Geothermincolia bacterium]